ncbi:hypothetical protein CWE12_00005 [Aliidiomarina sedimenti]|uniref:DUF805 domain-containing protein n=1 Tax=Aliidiomarina sedimenti TaxID=1933879 RepID=A0ABY0C0V8_9GAMM|nr:hypothetical protein CWE12_00005 [Aliidiomarina sedimenti]
MIIELMRTGDLSPLLVLLMTCLVIISPLAVLTAKIKNRLSISVIILCVIPLVNVYALFFLMLMRKLPKTEGRPLQQG